MLMMAAHVGDTNPAQPTAERIVDFWACYEMPMIWHQTVCKQFDVVAFQSFGDHSLKRQVVARLVKQPHSTVPAIENVINHTGFDCPSSAWHIVKVTVARTRVNNQ